ncbi:tetratricopeptide repeat protein [bacterium]|nr:tetratricopeptide repeat protein [candidate division CSSED10-310 bacterium]
MSAMFSPTNLLLFLPTLLMVLMVIDFARRRPDWYWLLIILFFGPIGAIIYFIVVVMPDLTGGTARFSLGGSDNQRINDIRAQLAHNPSPHLQAELGDLYFTKGRYRTALTYLAAALGRLPDHLPALYTAARCHLKLGDIDRAEPLLARLVEQEPTYDYGMAMTLLANLLFQKRRLDEARVMYEQVLSRNSFLEARYNYGMVVDQLGDTQSARMQMERVVTDGLGLPPYKLRTERRWIRLAKTYLRQHP